MKKFSGWIPPIFVSILVLVLFLLAAHMDARREAEAAKQRPLSRAEQVVREIHYIKDNRTKLCFAYFDNSWSFTLTEVPCTSIPPELIEAGK